MSRTRLDVVLVTLVALVALGLGAYLVRHVDSAPSHFERATCAGERAVTQIRATDAPFATLQRSIRAMAHSAGGVENDRLRIGAIAARTWMHRLHHAARQAGSDNTTIDTGRVEAATRANPSAERAWRHVTSALDDARAACHELGVRDA